MSVLYGLSSGIYFIIYYLARYRRETVRSNLEQAFPNKDKTQIIKLEKKFYRFLCDNVIETLASTHMDQQELLSRFHFTNLEVLEPYLKEQQSLQLLTIHQGNWEWLLQVLTIKLQAPMDAIYRPLHDSFFDDFFLRLRSRFGARLLPAEKAVKALLKSRREFRLFSMMAEQSPIRRDKKYWRPFLNRLAPFYLGTQKIAELTQYPVFYFRIHRVRRGYYEVSFEQLAEPPFEKGSFDILERYIDAAERAIIDQPETWMWSNRKWRRSPMGDDSDFFRPGEAPNDQTN